MATDFRILGPLEVVDNGATIDLGGQKQRALLAMLLLHPNEVVSTDRLIDALWEDDPPARAQKALQVYVSGLRKVIGPGRIETKPPGYLVRAAEDELDAARFEAFVAQGAFRDALALWRGPALGDFAYARFAATEIARLEELRLSALEARIEQDLAEGRHAEVAGELEGLVREHPLRERLRAQLMLALYRAGRQAVALDAYQQARHVLSDELGLEPSRELRELQQAILRHDPVLDDKAAGSGRAVSPRGIFVGREHELAELLEGLEDALAGHGRLLLLCGEPGIGKSRLADEVIAQARARGAQVLVGRSWEAGGAPAYWPWVQALRAYIESTTPEALRLELGAHGAYLAQLLPELRELLPELPEPPALESESARFRLFEAALQFLRRAAARRPVVLVLDDLHAADEPSLLFLQFVARELAESRILIIGAYRDVDPTLAEPLTTALVELGREPTTRTIALRGLDESDVQRCIYQFGDATYAPLRTLSESNLPIPATAFLGREKELREVASLLMQPDERLLTLTGPGGTGKTRLALQAAGAAADAFPDGVWWVSLAALRDPKLVLPTASQVLGAKWDLPAAHIGDRSMLVLLDNFEHVVEAAPELPRLLAACPHLRLVVTSRELLRVQGEVEYSVPPMVESEALELFCQRSRLEADATVAELCRRLDNLPLAVELAAARTRALSPRQILERLSGRLDLLRGGRDADARQETLRATIDWSYDLLTPSEQRLFARLSVFTGGCTLEAAEVVCEATVDILQALVDKSLLRFSNERYWMLETIREYAAERLAHLGEAEAVRNRHAQFFLQLAETLASELSGLTQAARRKQLSAELDNLRGSRALLALYITDSDGTLVYFNEAAERIAGSRRSFAEPGDMSVRHWAELLRPRGLDGTPLQGGEMPGGIAFNERRPAHGRLQITGLDGVERVITTTAFPMFGPDGEFHGIIVMFWEQD